MCSVNRGERWENCRKLQVIVANLQRSECVQRIGLR